MGMVLGKFQSLGWRKSCVGKVEKGEGGKWGKRQQRRGIQ